jgi:Sulfotransferase family
MVAPGMKNPILVTGSHRSGTTWVGRMLAADRSLGYVHEPFNPNRWPGWLRERPPYWYTYITEQDEEKYGPLVQDLLKFRYPLWDHLKAAGAHPRQVGRVVDDYSHGVWYRTKNKRPLIKDPIALLASEWFAQRFNARVVVMIRHPAAFASSVNRLSWEFGFEHWLDQPSLLRDWLGPFEEEMRHHARVGVDLVEQAILMWRALYTVIDGLRSRHPEWSFVRHEDLSADPITGYRDLFVALDLAWSERVEKEIRASSATGNPGEVPIWRHGSVKRDSSAATQTWRSRLSPDDIERVRTGTKDVWPRFYSETEW